MRTDFFRCTSWAQAAFRFIPLFTLAACVLCACSAKAQSPPPSAASYVFSGGTKPYVVVRGAASTYSPYLMYGVQLRLDQLLEDKYVPGQTWPVPYSGADGADYYFREAAAAGFKTVVVVVPWKFVDFTTPPAGASYNFEYVHKIIDSANAYGLKVQLLWYGSDVCGYSVAPSYVGNNRQAYPLNKNNSNFLDLSNPSLVAAETNALVAMMNDVAHYDKNNCVIMLGIENEADGCGPVESSLVWGNQANMASLMYAGGQYDAVNSLINTLAVAVKGSSWKGVTRTNLGSAYRSIDVVNNRADLPAGVDIFGVDLYTSDLGSTHNTLAELAPPSLYAQLSPPPAIDPLTTSTGALSRYATNVTHQPEGGGQYGNYISLVLSNFADGGGALIYELRTLQTWQDGNKVWQPVYDLGIYRRTTIQASGNWTSRTGPPNTVPYDLNGGSLGDENSTADIINFNKTVYKADQKIAVATPATCAAFNLDGILKTGGSQQTLSVSGVPVTFQTWNNGQAFAMMDANGDLILLNLTIGDNFILPASFHHLANASVGYYDSANVWHEQYSKPFSGNTLLCWAGECIRVTRAP